MAAEGRSYVHASGNTDFIFETIPDLVKERFQHNADDDFFVFLSYSGPDVPLSRSSITWRDLHENSNKAAVGLLKCGLVPGDRLAIFGRSIPEWIYVLYGSIQVNILCIPIPVSLMYSEKLRVFLQDHRVKLLVLDPGLDADIIQKVSANVPSVKALIDNNNKIPDVGQYPSKLLLLQDTGSPSAITSASVDGFLSADLTPEDVANLKKIQETMDPDDPAVVFATSGSTGIPKLIVHSHFNMINTTHMYNNMVDSGVVGFNDRPFNWMGSALFTELINKSRRIYLDAPSIEQKEYSRLMFRIFKEERVTSAMLMTYVLQVIKHPVQ